MTIKIKDRYFNYDNVDMVDFEIRQMKVAPNVSTQDTKEDKIFIINVLSHGVSTRIILDNEDEWKTGKERLEVAIINDYNFIEIVREK